MNHFLGKSVGETVLKVKVPPVRIENSLSPLYRGTDFTTLAETFQTVWGGVLFAVLSACVLPACKTDLSDVWNSIDNIDDRLSQVEKKIEEMNTNIDALS